MTIDYLTDAEIKDAGMKSLIDALGPVGAERFISLLKMERNDYTKWRRAVFDDMTDEEILSGVERYEAEHPLDDEFIRNLKVLI